MARSPTLSQRVGRLETVVDEHGRKLDEHGRKLDDHARMMAKAFEDLRQDLRRDMADWFKPLGAQVDALSTRVDTLKTEVGGLGAKIDALTTRVGVVEVALTELSAEVKQNSSDIRAIFAALQAVREELARLRLAVERANEASAVDRARIDSLERRVQSLEARLDAETAKS